MIIDDIRDLFTDEFINQYKDDYKAMRKEILGFMLKNTQYGETKYFHSLASSYYYGSNSNYPKLVRQLNYDLKLLKKYVKVGVLTNKDIKKIREQTKKKLREFIAPKIKEFFAENGKLVALCSGMVGLLLYGMSYGGVTIYRQIQIDNAQENICESIREDLNVSKFDYQAIDAVTQDDKYYAQIYGVITEDITSKPQVAKVIYEIDKDLYTLIAENVDINYSYNESTEMSGFSSSYGSKSGYQIFTKLDDLLDETNPSSYVNISNTNTSSYTDEMER